MLRYYIKCVGECLCIHNIYGTCDQGKTPSSVQFVLTIKA